MLAYIDRCIMRYYSLRYITLQNNNKTQTLPPRIVTQFWGYASYDTEHTSTHGNWSWPSYYYLQYRDKQYTLSHLENDRDVSAYSGGRHLSPRARNLCVFSHVQKEHRDWLIKDASCSVTSRSFSGWDKSIVTGSHGRKKRGIGESYSREFLPSGGNFCNFWEIICLFFWT